MKTPGRIQAAPVDKGEDELCWGTCVIEEFQDVNLAGKETIEEESVSNVNEKEQEHALKNPHNSKRSNLQHGGRRSQEGTH